MFGILLTDHINRTCLDHRCDVTTSDDARTSTRNSTTNSAGVPPSNHIYHCSGFPRLRRPGRPQRIQDTKYQPQPDPLQRRCFASLAANAARGSVVNILTFTYDIFIQFAGLKDGASHSYLLFCITTWIQMLKIPTSSSN